MTARPTSLPGAGSARIKPAALIDVHSPWDNRIALHQRMELMAMPRHTRSRYRRIASAALAILAATALLHSVSQAQGQTGARSTLPKAHAVHSAKPAKGQGDAFKKKEDILGFISGYREEKEPDRIPDLVASMIRQGLLSDPEKAGVYTGFLAGVIGENQVKAPDMITAMFPMPPTEQVVLIKAIVYSGLPDWKELLGRFVERMPARKVIIHRYLFGNGKPLDEMPLDDPFVLDVYWGYYFATGNWQPAIRIVDTLAWAGEKNDIEKLTIGSMAKWTFASNASRDKNLLDLAKTELNHRPEDVRKHLREVIEAAELFETGRLRTDALKAIEEIRTKGSQFKRDWSSWGTAGQTVLALGCVAAGALGQIQFGIPCVVGGALSSAALHYLGPEK